MRKKTRALSGASQEAYFRRILKAHCGLSPADRDVLLLKLRREVAQLRVRVEPKADAEIPVVAGAALVNPEPATPPPTVRKKPGPKPASARPFDPFTPNVIVVVRKSGRDAALAALETIDGVDNLKLLAREQRLSISPDLETAADVRAAIVTAAERRIANRMAAAT
jgi:hypothetical protein